ncbi:MAG: dipicolinate synthase subunit [Eubacteriales bacterium]|nr:dipicolinate synthase subunit [Eubacteriales bacterium]MDN5364604.1 dipicolinate synthase subunit [Eubacteriales bacterium]
MTAYSLRGLRLAVLGGDDRELVYIPVLREKGAEVRTVGLPVEKREGIIPCATIREAVRGADVIVLPMPGVDPAGNIRAKFVKEPLPLRDEDLQEVPAGTLMLVGVARGSLKDLASRRGLRLVEIAERDDVAIYNSIPSAEGALQMAMEGTDFTIHGSRALVLGFGRTGMTLARMLAALGARTTVAARRRADLARIYEMGLTPVTFPELPRVLPHMDLIFNTVPSLILDRRLLLKTNQRAYIIDLASAPGGVDFEVAAELGIKAVLAPGLPGKVAPRTAGEILARVLPEIIAEEVPWPPNGQRPR